MIFLHSNGERFGIRPSIAQVAALWGSPSAELFLVGEFQIWVYLKIGYNPKWQLFDRDNYWIMMIDPGIYSIIFSEKSI